MKTQGITNKRVIAFILSFLLVMQQSLAYQALATTITNADGSAIKPSVGDNTWNIGPDAINGQTGFKQFDQMNLSKGDILNFIYSYINQQNVDVTWNAGNKTHSVHLTPGAEGIINTFVALVNQGVNINGIVNALQEAGGALKTDGNLMIISPNGMVVGASGVLNVGSLSVIAPTQNSYDALSKYLNLPTKQEGRLTAVKIVENDPVTESKYTLDKQYSDTVFVANNIDRTFDPSTLQAGNGSVLALKDGSQIGGNIDFQSGSKVAARGDVNLQGGQVNVNGLVVAGLGNNHTEALTGEAAANELFTSLVNIDNMGSANTFVNNNGNIEIKSVTGTSIGGKVKNYGKGNITITNEGASGVNITGEVSNPNGNLTVTNSAGELLVDTTGIVKNKGTMTFTNNGSGTGIGLNGTISNTGTLLATNETGANGLLVGGTVTNDGTGDTTLTNKVGSLTISKSLTSSGGDLLVDNTGAGDLLVSGTVKNTGDATFKNATGGALNVTGSITNDGTLLANNSGAGGLLVGGTVNNTGNATFTNTNGALNISGNVTNTGDLTMTNSGNGGLLVSGNVTNGGTTSLTNSAGRLNIQAGGVLNANGSTLNILNETNGTGLTIAGTVNNKGAATITNKNGDLLVSEGGKITSSGSSLTIANSGSNGMNIAGTVENTNNAAKVVLENTNGALLVDTTGIVNTNGTSLDVTNTGADGMTIKGQMTNTAGTASYTNEAGTLLVDTTGIVTSNGTSLLVDNSGTDGMDIQGKVKNTNSAATVKFTNSNSDMKIGSAGVSNNIDSNANVNIQVTNGDLLNNGVNNVLIATTNGANLDINVTNGAIGSEVGPNDGVYTGIGTNARDLTKSVNIAVDGDVKAVSSGTGSLVNLASIDNDMRIKQIKADGRVILLADASQKGTKAYNVINAAGNDKTKPSVEGTGISIIASGNIGEAGNALTFRQNGAENLFYGDDATKPHVPTTVDEGSNGVDMLAIKDINIKGLDSESGEKLDTNIGGLISREGSINAEFSGDVYVRETTAANRIDLTTRGKNMYIEHLGEVPTYSQDYYGPNTNIHPEKAKLTALDLGSYWDESEALEYEHAADSTIVVKNGTLRGQGNDGNGRFDEDGNVIHEQDLTLVADNAYAGGYYFNMGKHRGENKVSTVTKDPFTNKLDNASEDNDADISIRGKAVRPDDVEGIGQDPEDRNYYYGGSSQGGDEGYDGVNGGNDGDKQGTEEDDDNLVVPEEEEDEVPLDTDTDTDSDTDTDVDTDTDSDTDTDTDIDNDTDNDNDNDNDDDTDTDNDTDTDTDTDVDTDNDNDTDSDSDSDNDNDTDSDSDTDTDNDDDTDSDNDTDTDTDADSDPDPEPEPEPTPEPNINYDFGKELYKQRVVSDRVDSIDKRQFMRFDAQDNQNPITFDSSTDGVVSITDISRGGVSLTHNKKLKVGDVVPVHIQYGDLTINANVKIVSASDVKAGGKFIDLDQATANKLLYLSLIEKNEPIVQSVQQTISTTVEE